jgi:hypothetical protein
MCAFDANRIDGASIGCAPSTSRAAGDGDTSVSREAGHQPASRRVRELFLVDYVPPDPGFHTRALGVFGTYPEALVAAAVDAHDSGLTDWTWGRGDEWLEAIDAACQDVLTDWDRFPACGFYRVSPVPYELPPVPPCGPLRLHLVEPLPAPPVVVQVVDDEWDAQLAAAGLDAHDDADEWSQCATCDEAFYIPDSDARDFTDYCSRMCEEEGD